MVFNKPRVARVTQILSCIMLSTFSWCIAHYGNDIKCSLHAASPTGRWQALHHSWECHTLVRSTCMKKSTAGLLVVKWTSLLLIFSWGFQPPQGVISLDQAFKIMTPLVLEQRYPLQATFGFMLHCKNIQQADQSCQTKAQTFGTVFTK